MYTVHARNKFTSVRKKAAASDRLRVPLPSSKLLSSCGPGEGGLGEGWTGLGADRLNFMPLGVTLTKFLSPNSVAGSVSSVGLVGSYSMGSEDPTPSPCWSRYSFSLQLTCMQSVMQHCSCIKIKINRPRADFPQVCPVPLKIES